MWARIDKASTDAPIGASYASVRLLEMFAPQGQVLMSGKDMHWHAVTRDGSDVDAGERLDAWNTWRQKQIDDVAKATQEHVMRPVNQVRAEKLLARDVRPVVTQGSVVDTPRDAEVRGQTWALIGIAGDAAYESKKSEILDTLGATYFQSVRDHVLFAKPETSKDASPEFYEAEFNSMFSEWPSQFMLHDTREASNKLSALVAEPLIAVFDASENADGLVAKADTLAKRHELANVDIAVVRMYVWIKLNHHKTSKTVERVNRNKIANDFFKAMRAAEVT